MFLSPQKQHPANNISSPSSKGGPRWRSLLNILPSFVPRLPAIHPGKVFRRPPLYIPPSLIARLPTKKLGKAKTKSLASPIEKDASSDFTDKQMRKYFKRKDWIKSIFYISLCAAFLCPSIAIFLFIYSYSYYCQYIILIGLLSLMVHIITLLILIRRKIPTDEEYDAWVKRKARANLRLALHKINQDHLTDQEIEEKIHIIRGFVLEGIGNFINYRREDILWKKGKDHNIRYSINNFCHFFAVKHQLVVILIDVNAVNHRDRREQILEYFFADVVAVTTNDEYYIINDQDYLSQSFTLRICDGSTIDTTIRVIPLEPKRKTYGLQNVEEIESIIKQIRLLLRPHKQILAQ